ncbi:glycerophosphodiester phosphodiesterase family protein [Abyssalbus ytuae]|uniref:Glycerophosphodiester phosphodiesterase family protein n=1 Tax=Abyssalbus ytuae TaxID=2926907 RepID=A0A9E6ZUY8_9FLAO|nr:glycerophosphodiester phosphodiesterase family protein [Abyssalbus ytuae]UOB17266.1 glycerophosphodiester phosphodiesterase family protein [Abyssalbus ytuae]
MKFQKNTYILSAFISFLLISCSQQEKREVKSNRQISVVSHRGANRLAPENTFASAKEAINNGTDYIEVDLRKSQDGIYYLFHDKTLERTTNGSGLFSQTPSSVIDTLDAGSWFNHSFKGEKIPRFENYLEWVKGKAKLYIDVKDINIADVTEIIKTHSMQNDCFFYFRKPENIKEFRNTAPDFQLKVNAEFAKDIDSLVKNYNPRIIETSPRHITDELIKKCHDQNLKLMVYIPGNDFENYQSILLKNVDMVQVDNPDIFNSMMKNSGYFQQYKLIAHRGGIVEDKYNEFDPRSIQAAIDAGYYMLEIDVRESKDSVLIVNHDDNFKRFFNSDQKVRDMTWEEIKKLKSEKGNYHPLSFEEVAKMCAGKIKMMIDIKPQKPSPSFYKKLESIMEKYDLLKDSYFIDKEARKYLWGKAKFEFRVSEGMEIKRQLDEGLDVSCHYFLFDHGNRLNAEAVKFCQKYNISVVASVNIGHYRFEDHLEGAQRDIEYWKKCGVTEFQIDSDYNQWLPNDQFKTTKNHKK